MSILFKKQDDRRARKERVRADLLPESDGVLEAVHAGRLGERLREEQRREEDDGGDVVEVVDPFVALGEGEED